MIYPCTKLRFNLHARWYRVLALATSYDAANEYCIEHRNAGVLGEIGELIVLADLYDKGQPA